LPGHLGGVRLDLMAASLAPHDEPHARFGCVAERHRRAGLRFHVVSEWWGKPVGERSAERAGFGATARLLSSDLSAVEKFLYKSKEVRSAIVRLTQVQTCGLSAPYRGTIAAAASASRCNRCKVAIARRNQCQQLGCVSRPGEIARHDPRSLAILHNAR
jgi:hypothetical protein